MEKKFQSGVMLLEALISLLIFAVGVLGMVGMQVMATKFVSDARYRAEAAAYADELLSQMWVDDLSQLSTQYAAGSAKFTAWSNRIQTSGGLPGASTAGNEPSVVIDPATNEVVITIRWQPPEAQAANRYVTSARLIP